jgi:hypothetical protein
MYSKLGVEKRMDDQKGTFAAIFLTAILALSIGYRLQSMELISSPEPQ